MNEDDIFSEMSIADATIAEGNEGNNSLEFTVSLSEAVEEQVTVNFSTVDNSTVAGEDYVASEGSLTFAPGETSQTISVDIIGDTAVEEDETFFVEIRNAEGVGIADMEAIGTITDDDSEGATSDVTADISVDTTSIPEGNEDETSTVTYTITLSEPAERDARVIVDSTGGNNPLESEPLDIPAGQQSVTFTNEISGDNIPEENETLTGTLGFAAFNAPDGSTGEEIAIGQTTANVTVTDDDGDDGSEESTSDITADLSVDVTSIPEGNDGETSTITYTVTLSEPVPDQSVRGIIGFETSGTENGELTFDDGADTGLDIAPGQTTGTFTYEFPGDNIEEPNETVTASLDFVGLMDDGSGNGRNETFNLGQSSVSTTILDDDGEDGSTDTDTDTDTGGEDGSTDTDTDIDPGGEDGNDIVYRFFNPTAGVHFYTDDEIERNFVEDELDNYEFEGPSYRTVDPMTGGAEDVYRFFNARTGVHLYTTDENERDNIIDNLDEFTFEGTAFNAYETQIEGSIPIYRFFEPTIGVHFYTPNEAERDFVDSELDNYNSEGIAYYVLPLETENL